MSELSMRPDEDLNAYDSRLREMLSNGQISTQDYFVLCEKELTKLYLSSDNPRAQSGHGGDIYHWRSIRWMILEAVYHDGSFIDIGCANGHLIESLDKWIQATDVKVEFYGLEISQGLFDLARQRLPNFASRLFLGNALYWKPPAKFDYVYTMILADIPRDLRKEFLDNLYNNCVKPGGRLILGPWRDEGLEKELPALGYTPSGYCEKTVPRGKAYEVRRIVWFDKQRQPEEAQ